MRRKICFAVALLASCLALSMPSFAQSTTTVSATIVDPKGLPLSFCQVTAQLIPSSSVSPTLNGLPFSTFLPSGCDVTGTFSMNLASNAVISPASSQWQFTVNTYGVPAPFGTGPQSAVVTLTISGSSQNISTNLNAAVAALLQNSNPSRVYNTAPAAGTSSITATTMVASVPAQPASGTSYSIQEYFTQTVLGASCAGNSTVALNLIFQDPNAASPQTITVATATVTTNGTLGRVPITSFNPFAFIAKPGSAVQYSTTFTPGGSCSPAPTVQVFPTLTLQ